MTATDDVGAIQGHAFPDRYLPLLPGDIHGPLHPPHEGVGLTAIPRQYPARC